MKQRTKQQSSGLHLLFVVIILIAATPKNLMAYVDPGSGSFLLQMLIAGILGASVTVKTFWKQIKAYFSRGDSSREE